MRDGDILHPMEAVRNMKHDENILRNSQKLRRNMTKEERHIWYDFLKTYPVQFKRQVPFGNYIVDFYCHKAKLAVELDGSGHYEPEQMEKDKKRTEYINKQGVTVLRFTNTDVQRNFYGVCSCIDTKVKNTISEEKR